MGILKMSAKEIQQKLQDDIFEEIKKLPTESLKKKLLMLNKVESERNEIEEKGYLKEYNELKLQYEKKYQEYHQQLSKIIQGEEDVQIFPQDVEKYSVQEKESEEKGVPNYWKDVLIYSNFFELNEKDEEILKHLKNITIQLSEEGLDFTVVFHFEVNEFFEHATLSKTYIYDKSTYEVMKANSTVITWNEGKNPSKKIKTKKVKGESKVVPEPKEITVPSFFDIFVAEESNENGLSEIPQQAEFVRDELLLNSLEYYLDIYESDDDDDSDDWEDDEESEEDEGKEKKSKNKGDSKKAEKCKNQ